MRYTSMVFAVLLACLVLARASHASVIFVAPAGDDSNSGLGWDVAKKTVQAGIDAASSGDEVWVAAARYVERVVLRPGVGLYGGFAGTERSRTQRNWKANVTVIEGTGAELLVAAVGACTIDGFTIRYGYGGIRCDYASPRIANNALIGNYRAIDSRYSSPTIVGNTIAYSYDGVSCSGGTSVVLNNRLLGNVYYALKIDGDGGIVSGNIVVGSYQGIDYSYGSSTITNNTVAGSEYFGIRSARASSFIANNIAAFNGTGILADEDATLAYNNVYRNRTDYNGIEPGAGDISADPMLASYEFGNLHVQPESPCRDAGTLSVPWLPDSDIDGQPRMQGGGVDIGADESDGTLWPTDGRVIYVDASAPPGGDGTSWTRAHPTITDAMFDVAANGGAEVWVAEGVYTRSQTHIPAFYRGPGIVLTSFAHLYGGFAGGEDRSDQRDPSRHQSIMEAVPTPDYRDSTAVMAASISTIDGFTIRNSTYGIACLCTSPIIRNNVLTGNRTGVVSYLSSPLIESNLIKEHYYEGIAVSGGWPVITRNWITRNTTGASCEPGRLGHAAVTGNLVTGNRRAGIYCGKGSTDLTNNTIAVNSRGILCTSGSSLTVTNNILFRNSTGIAGEHYPSQAPPKPVLSHNDLFGNAINYQDIEPGETDFSADPMFRNPWRGDYHLGPDSPCINAGTNDSPGLAEHDMDGEGRVSWGTVDVGADEYWPLRVQIDIKPGDYPNRINPGSRGLLAVAILSSTEFDATTIDPSTVRLAGAAAARRAGKLLAVSTDVDRDGDPDMLLHFDTGSLALTPATTALTLTGRVAGGDWVEGSDGVLLVGAR